MSMMERRAAAGTPTRSDVKFCRVAALAAVWGAVLVPAALLAGYHLLFVEGMSDRLALALVASAIGAGIALMVLGTRIAARVHPRAATLDRTEDEPARHPVTDRPSMA
jgi:hypothetical protein